MANDANGNQWYQLAPGLGSVGSYQLSGIPFATGSLPISEVDVTEVVFPQVTKFVTVRNNTSNDLRVGFSENGVNGTNYFILGERESFSGELRISAIYLRGDIDVTEATVVAGLTGIDSKNLPSNWTGSVGVG